MKKDNYQWTFWTDTKKPTSKKLPMIYTYKNEFKMYFPISFGNWLYQTLNRLSIKDPSAEYEITLLKF